MIDSFILDCLNFYEVKNKLWVDKAYNFILNIITYCVQNPILDDFLDDLNIKTNINFNDLYKYKYPKKRFFK